jgi:hypothetical protein
VRPHICKGNYFSLINEMLHRHESIRQAVITPTPKGIKGVTKTLLVMLLSKYNKKDLNVEQPGYIFSISMFATIGVCLEASIFIYRRTIKKDALLSHSKDLLRVHSI